MPCLMRLTCDLRPTEAMAKLNMSFCFTIPAKTGALNSGCTQNVAENGVVSRCLLGLKTQFSGMLK